MKSLILLVAAFVLIASAQTAYAQATPATLFDGEIDGYELVVTSLPEEPVVGTIHFTVFPTDATTSEPIRNADIRIVATRPAGGRGLQSPLLKAPGTDNQFEGKILFDAIGEWTIRVEIETAELGASQVEFPLPVAEQALPPGTAGVWVLLIVTLALVGGVTYIVYSIRRQRRKLAEASR